MMHVRFSLVAADPPVLADGVGHDARPVQPGRRGPAGLGWVHRVPRGRGPPGAGEPAPQPGLSLLEEPGVVIFESFWATHEALWLSEETEALFRGELVRRVERPVRAEDYQVAVFEREGPPGEAVQLTRMEVKPTGVADVVDVYGDTAVPWLAGTPRFPRDAAVRRPGRRAADRPDRVARPGRPGGRPQRRRDDPGRGPERGGLRDP